MKALHSVTDDARTSGMGCPQCPGVLEVSRTEQGYFTFRCRIGHVLSLQDLFVAKESHIDASLWSSVESLEELAALCRDLAALDQVMIVDKATLMKRAALASDLAHDIRQTIERNEPIPIAVPNPDEKSEDYQR
jgi:hypothetical protein